MHDLGEDLGKAKAGSTIKGLLDALIKLSAEGFSLAVCVKDPLDAKRLFAGAGTAVVYPSAAGCFEWFVHV